MSELLDRIQREIRERLEASRAAVREHERLEAALHALGDTGSRATRAVASRARGSSKQPSSSDATSTPAVPARKSPATSATGAKRTHRATTETAARSKTRRSSDAAAVRGGPASDRGSRARPRAATKSGAKPRAADSSKATRKRAAPGANRAEVLRVVGERPGVTTRELAAAAGVTGGTLYSLLRRLTEEGTLERRKLPGGQTGYAIADREATDADRASASREVNPADGSPGDAAVVATPGENDAGQ